MPTHDLFVEVATQGDATWFNKNPDRRLRLRNAVPGEFRDLGHSPVGMTWRVIVVEAQLGVRVRQPLALPIGVDNDSMSEAELFSLFMQAAPKDSQAMLVQLRRLRVSGARAAKENVSYTPKPNVASSFCPDRSVKRATPTSAAT
ncbi:MAG: hypothetical protein K0S56_1501 [Microvirga sp.]|jgi:hypothetical protein|nr:hypothetical protein [Microvirga sp.]